MKVDRNLAYLCSQTVHVVLKSKVLGPGFKVTPFPQGKESVHGTLVNFGDMQYKNTHTHTHTHTTHVYTLIHQ